MKLNVCKNWRGYGRIGLALFCGLWAAVAALGTAANKQLSAAPLIRYVAAAPAGQDSGNDCTTPTNPCATVQHAVDSASSGDEIRIAAGVYNQIRQVNGISQLAYIDSSLTIRGGYASSDFDYSYPITQPTYLDANNLGRGIVISGNVTAVIENITLKNGNADGLGGAVTGDGCGDAGGGIFALDASLLLTNIKVQSSTACDGGGIFINRSPETILLNSEISQNVAYDFGGGVNILFSDGAKLIGNRIYQNVASQSGKGTGTKHCGGARIYASSDVHLLQNHIFENSAANNGGGLCLDVADNALIQSNHVYNNARGAGYSGSGAGVYIHNSDFVNLVENNIYGNGGQNINDLGTLNGGGLYVGIADQLLMHRNFIHDNVATLGGGFYLSQATSAESVSNIFQSNQAVDMPYNDHGYGGGIFIKDSDILAMNSVIIDNEADIGEKGSGIFIAASELTLQHPTIARNNPLTGAGIFISNTGSTVSMTNSIVVSQGIGVDASPSNTITLFDTLWHNNVKNTNGMVSVIEEITAAPLFAADGYHLTPFSPALQEATPSTVNIDVDGGARPSCFALPALGADELQCFYLPLTLK